ncbi:AhpC/TSA family thioredoxin peroxidase, putative [Trichophyton verrucosum HKI 0517]|uniref:AhpC/TSA family thioredoxin peroxidase, putative n=1 Tax=Trichophyton verrucosum (strain HKI 0517) TaxID=663202 RepID=D4DAW6_TRIVH|nr:AhpC/TSA family thioredoxin peroxidase, putative [Trichophyton verrucosum HKI 0517]EFE41016.1 AhpC/TSA family thioredoxin peroxidase, putative [Trichophyton verrucosum HKI 0517]
MDLAGFVSCSSSSSSSSSSSAASFSSSTTTHYHRLRLHRQRHLLLQSPLRLGSTAPDFTAITTKGEINFHEFIGDNYVILFSHPDDFTPTCTTELGAFAKLEPEFTKRGVKLIGLSANGIGSHHEWIKDIDEVNSCSLQFPIIADADRKVSYLYDMIDYQDTTNVDEKGQSFDIPLLQECNMMLTSCPIYTGMAMTIRSVFIIDPKKKIRLIMSYPATTGRNTAEVLRCVDALQTTDRNTVNTAINWQKGDDVIVPPFVSTDDASKKFGQVREVKP